MKKLLKILLIMLILGGIIFAVEKSYQEKLFFFANDVEEETIETAEVIPNTEWKITQYGDEENQMMCYIIEGNNNGLAIVDGGYYHNDSQAEYVRNKIISHGGKVDAWIVTHFDSDHAGVFETIEETNPDFKIENLFVQDVPYDMEMLKENAPWEDEWDCFERFQNNNYTNIEKINKVHSGDEFEFMELRMKVLSSYDEWIDKEMNNLLNNGAILFKLYGKEESMLFCADVQDKKIEKYITENYKEDLPSDYIQVGHHGNNSFSKEFYKLVNPKKAFFSAPTWLMDNISNIDWFTVGTIRKWLEDDGVEIYWHNTAPNEFTLK